MDLFASQTSDIIERIRKGALVSTHEELEAAMMLAEKQRPSDYWAVVKGVSRRYSGEQKSILAEALKKAYPDTSEHMPKDPVRWLPFFASQDAGVYTQDTVRELLQPDGDAYPEDSAESLSFADAVDQVGGDVLMSDVERRMLAGAHGMAVTVGWRRLDPKKPGKLVSRVYWPSDVFTVCHPSALDDPGALHVVGLRQSRAAYDTGSDVWWVWSREVTDTADGPVFGVWQHVMVSEDGKHKSLPIPYDGSLPVVFPRFEDASGQFWPEPDRAISDNVDQLNVARSNRQHVINLQAHAQAVYSGTKAEGDLLIGGPDRVIKILPQEDFTYMTPQADHDAILASATRDLHELATARGNSPDAYAVTPGEAQSGVSRIIANAPHDERVARLRPVFERFEEQDLWPLVIELINRHVDGVTIPDEAYPRIRLGEAKVYETDTELTTRVAELLALDLIDKPRAGVMLRLFRDEQEAAAYYDEREAQAQPQQRNTLPGALDGPPIESQRETTVPPIEPTE